jgi:hypothetical protein
MSEDLRELNLLVCRKVTNGPFASTQRKRIPCQYCGEILWIGDAGLKHLREQPAFAVCSECAEGLAAHPHCAEVRQKPPLTPEHPGIEISDDLVGIWFVDFKAPKDFMCAAIRMGDGKYKWAMGNTSPSGAFAGT